MTQNYKYELLWPRSIKLLDNTENDLKSAKKMYKFGLNLVANFYFLKKINFTNFSFFTK